MKPLAHVLAAAFVGGALASQAAEAPRDSLADGFTNPPTEARPLVFWQWVNGNVTEEGIRLDLEWMRRIGLAGAFMFDIGFRTPPVPQYVAQRVGFGTEPWRKAVAFAASEAKRLGLLLGAQSGGGWSVSGGPSVPAEQAMKKLVWSEIVIDPNSSDSTRLPPPPSVSGPFQDLQIGNPDYREPARVADIAVIAFRLPNTEQSPAAQPATLSVAGLSRDGAMKLGDGQYAHGVRLTPDARGEVVIDASMKFVPRALTLGTTGAHLPAFELASSEDGRRYEPYSTSNAANQPAPVETLAFNSQHRYWQVRFKNLQSPIELTELRFEPVTRLNLWQIKAGFGVPLESASPPTDKSADGGVVDPRHIVDLTARMEQDGTLNWKPGEGRWAVLRFGWSLTGRRTVPATPESIGLEVDKLDATSVRTFAETFYGQYSSAMGARGKLDLALTDSWEAGQQNWTPDMMAQFARRRGYDLRAWMPALTGRVIGDVPATEKFLTDFRLTIADLVVDHYAALAEAAHRRGMTYYSQAPGTDVPTLVDGLRAKGRVDVPTGEFWYWPEDQLPQMAHLVDVREAASASHIYGKRFVAAESLTTRGEEPWSQGPAQWRRQMDRFFAEGVNRVILHTSVHQPFTDRRPGITLRQFGTHFTRNETWAEDADEWITYLARTSYLLQQGLHVADLAMYFGEGTPPTVRLLENGEMPRPGGFDYDLINSETLDRFEVRDGRLVLPDGKSYSAVMVMPGRMTVDVVRRLGELTRAGALLIGDEDGMESFQRALSKQLLVRDVVSEADGAVTLHWTHRALPGTDIYFLTNQSARPFEDTVAFRMHGRHVEIWDAANGSKTPADYRLGQQTTTVSLSIPAWSSRFVVFRGPARAETFAAPRQQRRELLAIDGSWDVEFLDGMGAPVRTRLPAMSWSASEIPAVRHYSGRAKYSREFDVSQAWLKKGGIELDLGKVGEMARVSVNGLDQGLWWNPPFSRDITEALRPGRNQLEITVTNYWANRLIGDEQPGAVRNTFSPIRPYKADSPLRPSGLLGPVRLIGLIPEKTP